MARTVATPVGLRLRQAVRAFILLATEFNNDNQ